MDRRIDDGTPQAPWEPDAVVARSGPMIVSPTVLERAFQLADSGEFAFPSEVRSRLVKEGFDDPWGQLDGTRVLLQLQKRCAAARGSLTAP